ncbi:MAG: lipase maturation factor family protein [Bacteroidetes bacterium]|nr:lipase maturation factor family protein [Bacteroidota bacterium]
MRKWRQTFRLQWKRAALPEQAPVTWRLLRTGIGLCYLLAFGSLIPQMPGIYGSQGILPLAEYYAHAWNTDGVLAILKLPSLLWLNASDPVLELLPWIGASMGALVMLGIAAPWGALGAWAIWLSFCAGHNFYIWDLFLLEAGLLLLVSLFLKQQNGGYTPRICLMAFRFLIFRMWLSMAIVKVYLSDPAWYDLSFMQYYWAGQPQPSYFSWYMAQLPDGFQRLTSLTVLVAEHLLSFWIYSRHRKRRWISFLGFACLSAGIHLTGNYSYFNILTLILGVVIVREQDWRQLLGRPLPRKPLSLAGEPSKPGIGIRFLRFQWMLQILLLAHLAIPSVYTVNVFNLPFASNFTHMVTEKVPAVQWALFPLNLPFYWRMATPYGVFRFIAWHRYELEIAASKDGKHWEIYQTRYRPDAGAHAHSFAPYHPRLDHALYYEAQSFHLYVYDFLYRAYNQPPHDWFYGLLNRLAQASPPVLALFKEVPLQGHPPRFLRLRRMEYTFTSRETYARTGAQWTASVLDTVLVIDTQRPIPLPPYYQKHNPQVDVYLRLFRHFGLDLKELQLKPQGAR